MKLLRIDAGIPPFTKRTLLPVVDAIICWLLLLNGAGYGAAKLTAPGQVIRLRLPLGADTFNSYGYLTLSQMFFNDFYRFSTPTITAKSGTYLILEFQTFKVLKYWGYCRQRTLVESG